MKRIIFILAVFTFLLPAVHAQMTTNYVEGEVIVTFKPGETLAVVTNMLGKKSLFFAEHYRTLSEKRNRQTGLVREKSKTTAQLIAELKDDPGVETVEPNYLRWVNGTPNDARFGEQWALNNTGQSVNGTAGTALADVKFISARNLARAPLNEIVVGVIDTGLDMVHPDIYSNVWVNAGETAFNGMDDDGNGYKDDVNGYDFSGGDADPSDSGYHGTHVAGTIAAIGDDALGVIGVNDRVRLLPLKVSNDGSSISSSAEISALQYATALKNRGVNIVVLNASFGGGGYSSSELSAIQAAGDAGIILCVAAGNSTANNDTTTTYPASYRTTNMIVVAASDQNDALASFSNYGATTVDLAAPGVNILSTQPSTVSVQVGGTTYSSSALAYSGLTTGVSGSVIDCGSGNSAAEFPSVVNGNIALIQRGTQSFATKVTYAKAAGAKAAIIYNNVSGTFSGTLSTATNWIPAYAISQADGQTIKAALPQTGAIVVTGNYQFLDGTSMATPHVSGAVSFAAMNFPNDTVAQRRARVLAAVDVKPAFQGKVITGGRLNLLRIVDANTNGVADWQPVITTSTLPPATNSVAYSQTLAATNGVVPYSWSITDGTMPNGFSLGTNGVISGTSSNTGTFSFTVKVTDSTTATATRSFILTNAASGALDHFTWDYAPTNAYAGYAFAVAFSARDSGQRIVTNASGSVNLTAARTVSPAIVTLTNGSFVGYVSIATTGNPLALTATLGSATGTSSNLTVTSGTSTAGDGIPDAWKTSNGFGITTNMALLDNDGDGLNNFREFIAGTDPNSAASVLKISSASTDGQSQFTFSFPGEAGKLYRVSTSTNLTVWTPQPLLVLPSTNGSQSVKLNLNGEDKSFFRVEIAP